MKTTANEKILTIVLVLYLIVDLLLTPFGGFETRPIANVSPIGLITLGLIFLGLIISALSIVLIFFRPRSAQPIIGALLYFPAFIADQVGAFSTLRPPSAITTLELIQAIIALGAILLGIKFRRDVSVSHPPN